MTTFITPILILLTIGAVGADNAFNLVRNLGASSPQVTVDSTFPGYHTAVLNDGRWIELGQELTQDYGSPDRLGNSGNTWVSAEATGLEHWVRLDWPQPVEVNQVEVWWALPEWYPRAFRLETWRGQSWGPLWAGGKWFAATEQRSVLTFPTTRVQTLRLVQHANGGGERDLMAVQEVRAFHRPGAALPPFARGGWGSEGVRELSAEELRRLTPLRAERNLARLHERQPGADRAGAWLASGRFVEVPALNDGSTEAPVSLPPSAVAVGVEWPIQHVIDGAALYFPRPPGRRVEPTVEVHDGAKWRPVRAGLRREMEPGPRCLRLSFEPIATHALRVRLPARNAAPTEIEIYRYLPAGPNVWPERLVKDNQLERELLASGQEASFEQLSTCALSMTPARALLGLKDAPCEIGVTWDGQILSTETLRFSFGEGRETLADYRDTVRRMLIDGWRPGTVVTGRIGDLAVRETAFVSFAGPQRTRPALFARVEVRNPSGQPVRTKLHAEVSAKAGAPFTQRDGCLVQVERLVLAASVSPGEAGWPNVLSFDLDLPPGQSVHVDLVQPYGAAGSWTDIGIYQAANFEDALQVFKEYWDELLAPGMTLHLPETRLNRLYKAVLTQLFINADGDVMPYGSHPSVYDGSLFGLEEGFAMMALAFCGFSQDAQRYLDGTYLTPEFLTKVPEYRNYADRHQQYRNGLQPFYAVSAYRFSRDREWIRKHLGLLRECAEWTIEQRRRTMVLENGEKPLHWGLLPKWSYGGDIADLQCYALYANFACWRGLYETAWLLEELGDADTAARYFAEAADYRQCLDRAVEGNYRRDQNPPFLPLQLYATGPVGDDYDQLFAGCLLDLQPFDLDSPQVGYVTDYLEQANLTFCGLPRFRRDVGPGGLDGLYGLGYILTKLHQDKIDEFLLGFYGYLAFNLERDTFASRETNLIYASDLHVRSRYPVPDASDPLPCSSAVALHFLRNMLVAEEPSGPGRPAENLRVLFGAPRAWFREGRRIRFRNAPTHFGPMSCAVVSRVSQGWIKARLTPPTRSPWHSLKLRLRHPEGKKVQRVTVNGQLWPEVDADRDLITLRPGEKVYEVVAAYTPPRPAAPRAGG